MKTNQTWGMVLIVAGMLSLIAVPLSGYFVVAMVVIAIFGAGYLFEKHYILRDDDDKDKEKEK